MTPSVGTDERECLQIHAAGLGIARCAGAPLHRATADEDGVADRDPPALPGVFDMRLATIEFDEHPEAPRIDRLTRLPAEGIDGCRAEE